MGDRDCFEYGDKMANKEVARRGAVWEFAAAHAHEPQTIRKFPQQTEPERDTAQKDRFKAKHTLLEQGMNLCRQLEGALGATECGAVDTSSDKELRGDVLLNRWESRGLLCSRVMTWDRH